MDEKLENPNEEKEGTPKVTRVSFIDPSRNIVQEIKNLEEEIIIENGKTLISKKRALEIALSVIPDLEDRYIFNISFEKPRMNIFEIWDDDTLENCWFITYSRITKSSGIMGVGSSMGIFINKYTGEVLYNDTLRD